MARVERIKQSTGLRAAHFTENDAVGSPPQSGFQEIVEGNGCLVGIGLAFDGKNIRLLDAKFRCVFNDDDALMLRDRLAQYVEQSCFTGSCSAADEQRLSAPNLFGKELSEWPRERAARDEVFDRILAAGKLADNQRWGRTCHWRDDRRKAAAVRELRIEDGIVLVQLFAKPIGNHFEAGAQLAGVEGNTFIPLHDSIPFIPPGRIRIAHDLTDAVVQEQRLYRAKKWKDQLEAHSGNLLSVQARRASMHKDRWGRATGLAAWVDMGKPLK